VSEEHKQMWAEMGLDLEAHDALLDQVSQAYQDTFVAQQNRPEAMGYFDGLMCEIHGQRIRELMEEKQQGRKIVGAYCVFVPEEIVLAAGATLVGLCTGAEFATEEVEKYLPRATCPMIKSMLGFKLGRVCPYLEASDLVVGENTCDGKKKAYEVMDRFVPELYVMDLPQAKSERGRELFRTEVERFRRRMEELTGRVVDAPGLKKAIRTVNARREALHRLQRLRAAEPAPISGLDALLANQVALYDDPVRLTATLHQVCDELQERVERGEGPFPQGAPRIVVAGCPMALPNWKVPGLVEASGGLIVGEESCIGERGTRNLTDEAPETVDGLMDGIADRYFCTDCAIFTPNRERLENIADMCRRYNADGVIHFGLQFCQPYLTEAFSVEEALEEQDIPVLRVETDYGEQDLGQLSTRIEAFLERLM
jgi:benzoyl-CoA reductase/2-hydroxyglutaryl-CoA dehydratase subunit BcrC/BadD/HgdB